MMGSVSYDIVLTRTAQKEVFDLGSQPAMRVAYAIDRLKENPRPRGVEKLKGRENEWRIRIGRFRILYSINDKIHAVTIFRVTDRKEVYRKR